MPEVKPTALVLGSGGAGQIRSVGCIKLLYERAAIEGIKIFAGTSFGAILSLFLVMNLDETEFISAILHLKLSHVIDASYKNMLSNLWDKWGVDDGSVCSALLDDILNSFGYKSSITFKELYLKTRKHLFVCASDIVSGKPIFFNPIDTPDTAVLIACQASMSIPIVFAPIRLPQSDALLVDGALFCPYPYDATYNYMIRCGISGSCIGCKLSSPTTTGDITSLYEYGLRCISLLLSESHKEESETLQQNTITLYISREEAEGGANTLLQDYTMAEKVKLIEEGYESALLHSAFACI